MPGTKESKYESRRPQRDWSFWEIQVAPAGLEDIYKETTREMAKVLRIQDHVSQAEEQGPHFNRAGPSPPGGFHRAPPPCWLGQTHLLRLALGEALSGSGEETGLRKGTHKPTALRELLQTPRGVRTKY